MRNTPLARPAVVGSTTTNDAPRPRREEPALPRRCGCHRSYWNGSIAMPPAWRAAAPFGEPQRLPAPPAHPGPGRCRGHRRGRSDPAGQRTAGQLGGSQSRFCHARSGARVLTCRIDSSAQPPRPTAAWIRCSSAGWIVNSNPTGRRPAMPV